MKLIFFACLVSVASTLKAESDFANIKVTADFPGGSAVVKAVDKNTGVIQISPRVQSKRGWPCWWYCKVDGAKKGQLITFQLTANTGAYKRGRVLSADWSQPDRAAISIDNVVWTQTEKCAKQDGVAVYTIEAPAKSF